MNDAAWHERSAAWTNFGPFAIYQKRDPTFEDVKSFVLIQVIMWRRPSARWSDLRPHGKLSGSALSIQQNRYFFTKCMQNPRVILPDYHP